QMVQGAQMYPTAYNQGYQPQQQYGQMDFGMQQQQPGMQYAAMQQPVAQQATMPRMEYGQQYQNAPQQGQQIEPRIQTQNAAPTEPQTPPPSVERDDLGVPAFLRRPSRK
ncbi:MAG: hypothetical protein RSH26_00590, partial [Clostridia bacterium]